jgi:hypothetical protein
MSSAIAGLVVFVHLLSKLVSFIAEIPHRCMELIHDMKRLKNILKVLKSEYSKTIAFLPCDSTFGVLTSVLDNTMGACQKLEKPAENISQSRIRTLKGVWQESKLKKLEKRVDGAKNEIELLTSAIRCPAIHVFVRRYIFSVHL